MIILFSLTISAHVTCEVDGAWKHGIYGRWEGQTAVTHMCEGRCVLTR
jgi:hypothetical protein